MTKPETLFEAASYDLNQFRERRIAERRATPRISLDRRVQPNAAHSPRQAGLSAEANGKTDDSV